MSAIVNVVSVVFVALSFGALAFFLHKVAWLLRYKRVQRRLIDEASTQQRALQDEALPKWDAYASAAWRVARAEVVLDGPDAYAASIERELVTIVEAVDDAQSTVPLLEAALRRDDPGDETIVIMKARARDGVPLSVHLTLNPPAVARPAPPDDEVYELDVASRYGFFRRALVFVTGLADVVYSAHHIAKMSQYSHVQLSTILRRLSLVILLVIGIVLEVVLGLRDALAQLLESYGVANAPLIALGAWTGTVALLYFTMFFVVRRKSRQHLRQLHELRDGEAARLDQIRQHHLDALVRWASDYGKTLDTAVRLTSRHVELLAQHYVARMRRRLAGPRLLKVAKSIGDALLKQLPEAAGELQDVVTTKRRSWRHMLWPRGEEMTDVVDQSQFRAAWQHIELTIGELRRGLADPSDVAAFWRQLAGYAVSYASVLPASTPERLRHAYVRLVEDASAATDKDLERFDLSLSELMRHLDEQLGAATHLLAARVELSNQRIEADAGKLQAEIIRCREAARLEAMAFEI